MPKAAQALSRPSAVSPVFLLIKSIKLSFCIWGVVYVCVWECKRVEKNGSSAFFVPNVTSIRKKKKAVHAFAKCSALSPAVHLFALFYTAFSKINYGEFLSLVLKIRHLLGNKGYRMYLLKIQYHVFFYFLYRFYSSNGNLIFSLTFKPLAS